MGSSRHDSGQRTFEILCAAGIRSVARKWCGQRSCTIVSPPPRGGKSGLNFKSFPIRVAASCCYVWRYAIFSKNSRTVVMQHKAAIRRESSEVAGEVKRLWTTGRSSNPTVSYTFTVNGTSFTGKAYGVPRELWKTLRVSSPLLIRYLPENPEVNHPSAWEDSATSLSLLLPDIGMLILAALGMMLPVQLRAGRRLVAEGTPAVALITKCSPAKGRRGISIEYEFRTEDGRLVKGISRYDSPQEIGASICVLYLLGDPRQNRPYQSLYYRVAP